MEERAVIKAHGNPTIHLPQDHAGGYLAITIEATDLPVWQSGRVSPGATEVRVDVWCGFFIGMARGWALLEPNRYRAEWTDLAGCMRVISRIQVDGVCLFDEEFDTGSDLSNWLTHGEWNREDKGLISRGGDAFLFREGAMHGELAAMFTRTDKSESSVCCGLLIRHYNVSAHLRLQCSFNQNTLCVHLIQFSSSETIGGTEELLAEESIGQLSDEVALNWKFNGDHHDICVNDRSIFDITNGFMGGVDIIGVLATPGIKLRSTMMRTSQWTPSLRIEHEDYTAEVRPGNIRHLSFSHSSEPKQNVFWESGLQFGHIGGSEIKFTQGSRLLTVAEGSVATVVESSGPMPRMVEQSRDVRGHAWSKVSFFARRIVVCDEVLAFVNRSVGPDLDILSRLISGPVRAMIGEGTRFRDWQVDHSQAMTYLLRRNVNAFPISVIIPIYLGDSTCRLLAHIHLQMPSASTTTGTHFAWHCPRGLTASYDFRAAPTVPGQLYRFQIVLAWRMTGSDADAEADLLNLRDDWVSPMRVIATVGRAMQYEMNREQPREFLDFCEAFDRSSGMYVVEMEADQCDLILDPAGLVRRYVAFKLQGSNGGRIVHCALNEVTLRIGRDVKTQHQPNAELWLELCHPVSEISRLQVKLE